MTTQAAVLLTFLLVGHFLGDFTALSTHRIQKITFGPGGLFGNLFGLFNFLFSLLAIGDVGDESDGMPLAFKLNR